MTSFNAAGGMGFSERLLGIGADAERAVDVGAESSAHFGLDGSQLDAITLGGTTAAKDRLLSIFYGALSIMMIVSLALFALHKESTQLLLLLVMLGLALNRGTSDGTLSSVLLPGWNLDLHGPAVGGFFAVGALALFTATFLNTRSIRPSLHRLLTALAAGNLLLALISCWHPASMPTLTLSMLMTFPPLILSGFYAWRHGFKPARLYLLAWTGCLIAALGIVLAHLEPAPSGDWTQPGVYLSSIWLVLLLFLSVADRTRLQARQSDDAYLALKRSEADLEELVQKRTNELEDARDQAQSANQAKSEFLANVSHELRTPMNAVVGFASLLEERERSPENATFLDAIQSAGKTLLRLIDDLLNLSRIDAGRLELRIGPTDLWAMGAELMGLYAHQFSEKGLDFRVSVDPQVPRGLALDEVRIRQILFNLIDNAKKFTDQGGVEFEVAATPTENGQLHLQLSVCDTGPGIPDEKRQTIFAPFARLQAPEQLSKPGTGLGLAISQRLAQLMGGEIGLENRADGGSIFTLDLPGVGPAEQPDAKPVFDAVLRGIGPARILVADDDPLSRTLLTEYLADSQLDVLLANDGRQAVHTARARHPDLILMDIGMPVLNGIDAAKALKNGADTVDIPIIAVTAATMGPRAAGAARVCDAIIAKPVTKSQLFPLLFRFLSGRSNPALHVDDGEPLADAVASSAVIEDDEHGKPPGTENDKAAPLGAAEQSAADVLDAILADESTFRQSLANRLHDETLQTLFLAQLQLQTGAVESGDEKTCKRERHCAELIQRSQQELRGLLFELTMDRLLEDGLTHALSSLALHFRTALSIPFVYESGNRPSGISIVAERLVMQALLRIVRERGDRTRLRAGRLVLTTTHREADIRLSLEREAQDRVDRGPTPETTPEVSDTRLLTDYFHAQLTMKTDGDLWSLRIRIPHDRDAQTIPSAPSPGQSPPSPHYCASSAPGLAQEATLLPHDYADGPNTTSWQPGENQ